MIELTHWDGGWVDPVLTTNKYTNITHYAKELSLPYSSIIRFSSLEGCQGYSMVHNCNRIVFISLSNITTSSSGQYYVTICLPYKLLNIKDFMKNIEDIVLLKYQKKVVRSEKTTKAFTKNQWCLFLEDS